MRRATASTSIEEHYTDTSGFTDHVFAMMHLLGFRFASRPAPGRAQKHRARVRARINVYVRGGAEEVVSRAIRAIPARRHVLYFPLGSGPSDRSLSRKHIREQR
jgi:TnpA family transposase